MSDDEDDTDLLPEIGETAQSIRAYICAVANALGRGAITNATAACLEKLARGALACTKHIDDSSEIERLERAVREAREVAGVGRANETKDRQNSKGKA